MGVKIGICLLKRIIICSYFGLQEYNPHAILLIIKKSKKPQKEKQKKKAQKEIKKGRSILQILRQEGVLKKKELAVQKDADGEAKKTQVTVKLLANEVHKNSPGDVQKTRI